MMINCIAIDDEPMALEVIERYCSKSDLVRLNAVFLEPSKAIEYLGREPANLVFLDINMPGISGMQLAQALPGSPMIIFTTAYSHYAVDSYSLNAVDYLLKPITFERFHKAVNKAIASRSVKNSVFGEDGPIVFFKSGPQTYPVKLGDILYLEKDGNYMTIHLRDRNILIRENMSDVFDLVPDSDFIRIHKSFVIAVRHIEKIENHQLTVNGQKIPVGSTYRGVLRRRLGLK
jgi:two-component system LytT family response regulator